MTVEKLKTYTGDFIWSQVEYGNAKDKFFDKEFYLKEDVDKLISELENKNEN